MSARRRFRVALAAALLTATGCGSGSDAPSTGRDEGAPLTIDQAEQVAFTLFRNTQKKTAAFRARHPLGDGRVLVMTGVVDFPTSRGTALLQVDRDGALTRGREVAWTKTTVIEGDIPGLRAEMATRGRPNVQWVERPADSRNSIDATIVFLTRMSATRADNPALIAQGKARYLTTGTAADGARISIFRMDRDLELQVGDDGLLRSASGRIGAASSATVVELRDHGTAPAPRLPPADQRVELASIRQLYQRLIDAAQRD